MLLIKKSFGLYANGSFEMQTKNLHKKTCYCGIIECRKTCKPKCPTTEEWLNKYGGKVVPLQTIILPFIKNIYEKCFMT